MERNLLSFQVAEISPQGAVICGQAVAAGVVWGFREEGSRPELPTDVRQQSTTNVGHRDGSKENQTKGNGKEDSQENRAQSTVDLRIFSFCVG